MKSSIKQTRFFSLSASKLVLGLAFVSVIGGLSISPAFAERGNDNGRGHRDGGRHEWRGDQREWHGDRGGYNGYRPEYQRPYYYAQPVYAPPPVYYGPRQSPGVSLFLPLDFRR